MNYLFINTSNNIEIALSVNGAKLSYQNSDCRQASQILLPKITELTEQAKINLNDLDVFFVATGPGSFTGLRIAIATVKAFSQSLNKPVYAVNSFILNAYNISTAKTIISIIDASNNISYFSAVNPDYSLKSIPKTVYNSKITQEIEYFGDNYEIVTDNYALYPNAEKLKLQRLFTAADDILEKKMQPVDYLQLEPFYLRKSQPERLEGDI